MITENKLIVFHYSQSIFRIYKWRSVFLQSSRMYIQYDHSLKNMGMCQDNLGCFIIIHLLMPKIMDFLLSQND